LEYSLNTLKSQALGTDLEPTDTDPGPKTLITQQPNCHSEHISPSAVTLDFSENDKQNFMNIFKIL